MNADTAELVLAIITCVAALVWIAGLQVLSAAARSRKQSDEQSREAFDLTGLDPKRWLFGGVEVEGEPKALVEKATALLIKENAGMLGPLKILERGDDHIHFERVGAVMANQPQGTWFRQARLRFTPIDQRRTRIDYAVELAPLDWLLWVGAIFQVCGLVAMIVGCWVIYTYAVHSPNPQIRWQTLQMMQVVHFIWPPFLFAVLYRRGMREVVGRFEALAHNLPYYKE